MKQILQSLKSGETQILEVPAPLAQPGSLLICTHQSLISSGTEKMLVSFGKSSLFKKIQQQPDKVRMVLDKVKTDGLFPTIDAVRNKLEQLLPMGYCNVGSVIAIGAGVEGFEIGDRVVSNGPHAEIVCVPKNLCCKIPDNVTDEQASFTVLGAIALQGIRLANPTLGERFVVMGLGMIGLLTVQLLRAQGISVLAMDFNQERTAQAARYGASICNLGADSDPIAMAAVFSRQQGVDGVIITATTSSNEPIHQAASMCRKRGRIILVGITGLALSRADFYEKELSFQVSCSYGPGRYDPNYELAGHDYPIGYVRWTEQRNFVAFLDMLADGRLVTDKLISHRFPVTAAKEAYEMIEKSQALGILIDYPNETKKQKKIATVVQLSPESLTPAPVKIGFIGAGNYASRTLLPAFKRTNAKLHLIASRGGVTSTSLGKKFGFDQVTTEVDHVFAQPQINTVVIASRHDSHARLVCQGMEAEKNIFVEKPLCLTMTELNHITEKSKTHPGFIMIGFNRRFAPHTVKIKSLLESEIEPKAFIITVNAGSVPVSHWTQDKNIGGGRIVGEVCHFIDLLRYLAGAGIESFKVMRMGRLMTDDNISLTLKFMDGSIGTIHYYANGNRGFPKERLEIFCAGKMLQCDNFRKLRGFGWKNFKQMNLWRQNKGQFECVKQFVDAIVEGRSAPIPLAEMIEVSRLTIEIANDYS